VLGFVVGEHSMIVSDGADHRRRRSSIQAGFSRKQTILVGASIVIFAIGLFIDALPNSDTHDRYWVLLVAPSMIAFVVGAVALLLLLLRSFVPQRPSDGG
jgi:cytochrome P450